MPASPAQARASVLAVDVGGTWIKGAIVGSDGDVFESLTIPTATAPDAVEAQVGHVATVLARAAERRTGRPALAAGVAVPGHIDSEAGIVLSSANIGWAGVDVKALLARIIDVPFALGHDARAAALAEWKLGAGCDVDDFLFVGIGTGMGAAVVADGVLRGGRHGLAGEIGHIRAASNGRRCGCGAVGCLETIASASAIQRRYRERNAHSPLPGTLSAPDILRRADEGGDYVAALVRDEAIMALASVLMTVQGVIDIGVIILGGGLSLAGDSLLVPLAKEMERRSIYLVPPELRVATFGSESGFRGAAIMAWQLLGVEALPKTATGKPGEHVVA
jgi:glucokinase